jgi:hypothetical protein
MKKILMIIFIVSLATGCAVNKGKAILAVNATNIGFALGVNPLNQTPEIKLNYGRLEGMVVPTSEKVLYTLPALTRFNFTGMAKNPGIESLIATGQATHKDSLSASSLRND